MSEIPVFAQTGEVKQHLNSVSGLGGMAMAKCNVRKEAMPSYA